MADTRNLHYLKNELTFPEFEVFIVGSSNEVSVSDEGTTAIVPNSEHRVSSVEPNFSGIRSVFVISIPKLKENYGIMTGNEWVKPVKTYADLVVLLNVYHELLEEQVITAN
jgi:hypothetical protein